MCSDTTVEIETIVIISIISTRRCTTNHVACSSRNSLFTVIMKSFFLSDTEMKVNRTSVESVTSKSRMILHKDLLPHWSLTRAARLFYNPPRPSNRCTLESGGQFFPGFYLFPIYSVIPDSGLKVP